MPTPWSLGWRGEQRDGATGLTHLRARDYDPLRGRFTSADSLSPNGSGTKGYDPYGYAQGNPATLTDPGGHSPEGIAGAIGGIGASMRAMAGVLANLRDLHPAAQGLVGALLILGMVVLRMLIVMLLVQQPIAANPLLGTMVGGALFLLGVSRLFQPMWEWGNRCASNPTACLDLPNDFPRLPDVCTTFCERVRQWVFDYSRTFGICALGSFQANLASRVGAAGALTVCLVIDSHDNGGFAISYAAGVNAVVAGFTSFSAMGSYTNGYLFSNAESIYQLAGASITFDGSAGGAAGWGAVADANLTGAPLPGAGSDVVSLIVSAGVSYGAGFGASEAVTVGNTHVISAAEVRSLFTPILPNPGLP